MRSLSAKDEAEVREHLDGYWAAKTSAEVWPRSPEFLIGYARGLADKKRGEWSMGSADRRVRERLAEDAERRIGASPDPRK